MPTRETETSCTAIDHIYINSLRPCKAGVLKLNVSDHYAVFCSIPSQTVNVLDRKLVKFRRNFSEINVSKFKDDMAAVVYNFSAYDLLSSSDRFEIFNNMLNLKFEKNFPVKTKFLTIKHLSSSLVERLFDAMYIS